MRLVNGSKLLPATRAEVLRCFMYRWTFENERRARYSHSVGGHNPPTMPLVTDEQWLREHAFYVRNDGALARNRHHCEPHYMAQD